MIPDEEAAFGRDHNQPPGLLPMEQATLDLKELLQERVQDGGKTFAERKEEFLRSARNAVVRDRDTAGAAADVIKLAGRVWDRIHAARMERSQPYRDVAEALGRAAGDFWHDVQEAMDALRVKIDRWTDEEDERIAAQQREQEEEMRRMRAAAAPPPPARSAPPPADLPPPPSPIPARRRKIQGDYGAAVVQADRTTYTVTDVRALPDHILNAPAVHEAIIAVVKRTAKDMGVPAGIASTTTTGNQIR